MAELSPRQHEILFRLLRVAYPHDRFPDGPYQRVAAQLAAPESASDLKALADGLDALDAASGDDFTGLDEAAATARLQAVESAPFFVGIRAATVVALYDDREVWSLLGYEGPSFEHGGYVERGFDDLDWLPEARITETDEPRVEIGALDGGSR